MPPFDDPRYDFRDDHHRERRDYDRPPHDYERDTFRDDKVADRGFGIRIDPDREPERPIMTKERRESRRSRGERDYDFDDNAYAVAAIRKHRDEHRAREEERLRNKERGESRNAREDDDRPRKDSKDSQGDDGDRKRFRDKVGNGFSVAAAAMGLKPTATRDRGAKEDGQQKVSPPRQYATVEVRKGSDSGVAREERLPERPKQKSPELPESQGKSSREGLAPPASSSSTMKPREISASRRAKSDHSRRDEVAVRSDSSDDNDSPTPPSTGDVSDEDATAPRRRRRHHGQAFKPNDTATLMEVKAKLAALEESSNRKEAKKSPEAGPTILSPPAADKAAPPPGSPVKSDDSTRGRELTVAPSGAEKQVRVVSPPRDPKGDGKPIRGILKPPTTKFPEEKNPEREGVAPHKDDKTKRDVPPGARWTKISRRLVNPEALTIGKERFESRDDFVIVLRVLSREEIQAYTDATAQLRGMFPP